MALSVQNKNFLSLLHKLDIDVKQFPDVSFDGLFENVPKVTNYFFDWFMENISSDNVLTQSEQGIYFELEQNNLVPTEEEVNYFLSSCNPTYEELQSLDINYIKNLLPEELEELKKNQLELTRIASDLDSEHSEVKKKQNSIKESISVWKKQLVTARENCSLMNELVSEKLNEVKLFLIKNPEIEIDIDLYRDLLKKEEHIFNMFKSIKFFENEKISLSSNLEVLPKLREDLTCVNMYLILSQAFIKENKTKVDVLSEMLQKLLMEKSFNESISFNLVGSYKLTSTNIVEEIQGLESELHQIIKDLAHCEIQKISDEYLLKKTELHNTLLSKVTECRDFAKSSRMMDSWLLQILIRCNLSVEATINLRKEFHSNISEDLARITDNISNFELRKQRFKEVTAQTHQHPFLLALKNINIDGEDPEHIQESLKKMNKLITHAIDDSNFTTHRFRSQLQSSIRSLFENSLCGPTSQILFAPIELIIKFQDCKEHESKLSQVIKRLANKYVEAKEIISKSDRKKLLLWIDFLTNPTALEMKTKSPSEFRQQRQNLL